MGEKRGRKRKELPIGARFGRWTVIADSDVRSAIGRRGYICRCDCGTEQWVATSYLTSGGSRSCGCLIRDTKGTDAAKVKMARVRAAIRGNPMRGKRPDRPYRPKDITQFGMDAWMFWKL